MLNAIKVCSIGRAFLLIVVLQTTGVGQSVTSINVCIPDFYRATCDPFAPVVCDSEPQSSRRKDQNKFNLNPRKLVWDVPRPESTNNQDQAQTVSAPNAEELAKKLSNPVAALISVPFQSNFDFGMGTGSGWRYTMNFQPVIPISLSPKWNLISRSILPIIHQHNVANIGSQSGLGDITQSLFFSPTDSKKFIWGAGPVVLIPTATNDLLGTEKFGLGPTLLILKQEKAWTYGLLTNHIWSVAGNDSRASVNSTFFQPLLSYNTRDAWTFGLNAESSYDWTGNHWNVPIHFSVSKLTKFGQHHVSFGGTLRCWATSSPGGPKNCGLRIVVTPLFPK